MIDYQKCFWNGFVKVANPLNGLPSSQGQVPVYQQDPGQDYKIEYNHAPDTHSHTVETSQGHSPTAYRDTFTQIPQSLPSASLDPASPPPELPQQPHDMLPAPDFGGGYDRRTIVQRFLKNRENKQPVPILHQRNRVSNQANPMRGANVRTPF